MTNSLSGFYLFLISVYLCESVAKNSKNLDRWPGIGAAVAFRIGENFGF